MRKLTALTLSLVVLFSSFVLLRFSSWAQVDKPVDTVVVVGEMYSQITLNPLTVEVGEQSTVNILVRDAGYNPRPNRDIEIYEGGGSPNLIVTQPTAPSDPDGNVTGYATALTPGSYSICAKDVTSGVGIVIAACQPLTVTEISPPVFGPEPEHTPGDTNTVSWTMGGTGTYEYYVEVSTTSNFSNIVGSSGWISDTSYTATNLNDNQIYYYRVRARNSRGGMSDWSASVSSTQDASGPTIVYTGASSLPTGTTTEDFDSNETITLAYTLSDSSGFGSRNFSVILLGGTKVTIPYTATFDGTNWIATIKLGDLPKENGVNLYPAYSFYLEVADTFGNISGNGTGNITIPTPPVKPPIEPPVEPPEEEDQPEIPQSPYTIPGVPVQVTPLDDPRPKWTWVPAYDNETGLVAPGYEVQWCFNRNFIDCMQDVMRTDTNEATLKNPLEEGTWYVRVRVYNPETGKYGDWSDTSSFLIVAPPEEKPPVEESPVEDTEKTWFKGFVNNVSNTVKQVGDNVNEFLDDTIGNLKPETREAITVSALVGNMVAGMNSVLSLLGSVPYYFTQLSIVLLSLLGFRKKGVLSGYVYDSITKDPIGQAIVRVFSESGTLVWTDVTDIKGRYKTPELEKGKYKIKVTARKYEFPSQVIIGNTDFPLENIYHGGVFTVQNGKVPDFSIPLDSIEATKVQIVSEKVFSRTKWLWKILHSALFIVGLAFSIYALRTNPVWWNYLILFLYIPSLILLLILLLGKKEKFGIVKDDSGEEMKGITIQLSDSEFDKVVATRVTDVNGQYRFLVDPGVYSITIASRDYELLHGDKYQSVEVKGKGNEILAPNLTVKRKE